VTVAKHSILYADCPWSFEVWDRATGLDRAPDQHYDTLTTDDLCTLPIGDLGAPNSLLAMWVYDPMYPDALRVAQAWGYTYVTVLFRWLKTTEHPGQLHLFPIELPTPPMGLGHHTRAGGCEEIWLFKRGRGLPVLRHDIRREQYFRVREHSRKPDEFADMLVALYGAAPRCELFTRTRRSGWDVAYSPEADRFRAIGA